MRVCLPKIDGRRLRGFTLIELLVTLSVAAIFLAIAIPSYRAIINRNSIATQVNNLLADLNYARSEAITRGNTVRLCKSADEATCLNDPPNTSSGWQQGWIVINFRDDVAGELLRVQGALEARTDITGNLRGNVNFDANGFAIGSAGTIKFCDADDGNPTRIVISTSGRIRSVHGNNGDC